VLIQLTLPPGEHVQPAPQTVLIQLAEEQSVSAHLVSLSPRTDPRIQGESFFYIASPPQGIILLPGMDVRAFMLAGPPVQGVMIPASAVVWRQGKAWAYLQVNPEGFARRQVPTDTPVGQGYFVTENFLAGDRVVLQGAQSLLSEEFLPKAQEENTD
jgi:multidrug efflux pump subunit AcrA (membrane-fusion protein)